MNSNKFELPKGEYRATLTRVYALSGLLLNGSTSQTNFFADSNEGTVDIGNLPEETSQDILLNAAASKAFAERAFKGTDRSASELTDAYVKAGKLAFANDKELLLTVRASQVIDKPTTAVNLEHCILCIENRQLEELEFRADRLRESAMAALCLAGHQDLTHGGVEVARYVKVTGTTIKTPIFRSEITGGRVEFTGQTSLVDSHFEEARKLVTKLAKIPKSIAHAPKLLIDSHETEGANNYRGFSEAWVGLEVFVKGVEKQYWRKLEELILKDGPAYQHQPLLRLMAISSQKLSLADKFLVTATVLAPLDASADTEEYLEVKKARDRYFHSLSGDPDSLPTQKAQRLLRKYLKLHLTN